MYNNKWQIKLVSTLLVVLLLGLSSSVNAAAGQSTDAGLLPTSALYPIKEWWRGVQLWFQPDALSRATVRQEQLAQRVAEVEALFAAPADQKTLTASAQALAVYQRQSADLTADIMAAQEQLRDEVTRQQLLEQYVAGQVDRQYGLRSVAATPVDDEALNAATAAALQTTFDELTIVTTTTSTEELVVDALLSRAGGESDWVRRLLELDLATQLAELFTVGQQAVTDTVADIDTDFASISTASRQAIVEHWLTFEPEPVTIKRIERTEFIGGTYKEVSAQVEQWRAAQQQRDAQQALEETRQLFE